MAEEPEEGAIYFVSTETARRLLRFPDVVAALTEAYSTPLGPHALPPRTIARGEDRSMLRVMPAAPPAGRYMGLKMMAAAGGKLICDYVVPLYDRRTSRFAALVDALEITHFRTAGTTTAALRKLAPERALQVGVMGSGVEAKMHVRGMAAIRPLKQVLLYSTNPERREKTAALLSEELGCDCRAVDRPEAVAAGADVLIGAARSHDEKPILYADWIADGTIVASIGSTVPDQREIDVSVVAKSDLIVCDGVHEVSDQTGDMIEAKRQNIPFADKIFSLNALLSGEIEAHAATAKRVLFKSTGSGLQDVVIAEMLLGKAIEAGLAQRLPIAFEARRGD